MSVDTSKSKIIHWATIIDNTVNGMDTRVKELVKYERRLGLDARIIDPLPEGKAGSVLADGTKLDPWKTAKRKDVHVVHSDLPKNLNHYKNVIAFLHATPEYTLRMAVDDTFEVLTSTIMSLRQCDYAVTMYPRHLPYWKALAFDPSKVMEIPNGIDLERWCPMGDKEEYYSDGPVVSYMDVERPVKSCFNYLFAMKYVLDERPDVRFNLYAVMPENTHVWSTIINQLGIKDKLKVYSVGPHLRPDKVYRGSDLLVSHCLYGDVTRVAMEAMACGCPTIIPNSWNGACEYYDDGEIYLMESTMLEMLKEYPDRVPPREFARQTAEKNYNIGRTAEAMKDLIEKL